MAQASQPTICWRAGVWPGFASCLPVAATIVAVSCGAIFFVVSKSSSGVSFHRNHLPQWRLDGGVYFVTWRLNNPSDELAPAERTVVADTIRHFNHQRYSLAIFVVMDNHVHVLLQTLPGFKLSSILQLWKSYSSRKINELRAQAGPLWQKDSYTELMRNDAAIESRRTYIYDNPRRKWSIEPHSYKWLECFE